MKVNYEGCAICDSTWGNLWAVVEGRRLFFCCRICLHQFQNLVERIENVTGWDSVDALSIAGDRTGRTCRARRGNHELAVRVTFNADGDIRTFENERFDPQGSRDEV